MLIEQEYLLREYPELTKCRSAVHIGAHRAQELSFYREMGVDKIVWIEANRELAAELVAQIGIQNKVPHQLVVCAASYSRELPQAVDLHVASNDGQSSSLLPLGTHAVDHPDVTYTKSVKTYTRTLDTLSAQYRFRKSPTFLNIDIQGVEWEALVGGVTFIRDFVSHIYTEVNQKDVYAGCKRIEHIDMLLEALGFTRKEVRWTDAGWGDALYVKETNG